VTIRALFHTRAQREEVMERIEECDHVLRRLGCMLVQPSRVHLLEHAGCPLVPANLSRRANRLLCCGWFLSQSDRSCSRVILAGGMRTSAWSAA
jgi:hypothetical protein